MRGRRRFTSLRHRRAPLAETPTGRRRARCCRRWFASHVHHWRPGTRTRGSSAASGLRPPETRVFLVEVAEVFWRLCSQFIVRHIAGAGDDDGCAVRACRELGEFQAAACLVSSWRMTTALPPVGSLPLTGSISDRCRAQIKLVAYILDGVAQRAGCVWNAKPTFPATKACSPPPW